MLEVYRKLFGLLDRRERRRFGLLIVLVLVMGSIEAAGLASILPFLAVLSDPGSVERNAVLAWLYSQGGFESVSDFLVALGIAVFAIILFGFAFKMLTLYAITRFGQMRSYSLSARLFRKSVGRDYEWFLTNHSANLSKNILSEVDEVVNTALLPAIRLISFSIVVLFMAAVLVAVDPIMAVVMASVIGGFYAVIYLLSRRKLARIGAMRVVANRERFHVVNETLGGIKDVKLRGLESDFAGRFRDPAHRMARYRTTGYLLGELPRHALEAVLLGGIILIVLFKLFQSGGDLAKTIPVVGLYALAGMRLFPVTQNIYRSLSALRMARAAVDNISDSLADDSARATRPAPQPAGPRAPMQLSRSIELRDISYRYPGTDRSVIEQLSVRIEANATVAFVGATGSGKSTAVDIILGLLRPQGGELRVDGRVIGHDTLRSWQDAIGYVPQQIFITDDTIAANIAYGVPADKIDRTAVERAAKIARIHDFVMDDLPKGYDTLVGERGIRLSGGQRQRIGIARALYHNPQVLILDEATSALDNLTERSVMEAVHGLSGKKTIVIIAHRLSTIRQCDNIVLLNKGSVVGQGPFRRLAESNHMFREMCGELVE